MSLLCIQAMSYSNHAAPEPPGDIQFIDLCNRQIVLTWSPVESTCALTYYSVISNCTNVTCSSSSGATNLTTDSCPLLQQLTGVLVCSFNVESVVCGNLKGSLSSPAVVTLKGIKWSPVCIILYICILITSVDSASSDQ